jgi:hypothetical protein
MDESQSLKRLRYFAGQMLTAESLQLEQNYFREKLKRHNRTLHGFGIVSGLKVNVQSGQILVEPGLALDCEGNELGVPSRQTIVAAAAIVEPCSVYVSIHYVEEPSDEIPIVPKEPAGDSTEQATQTSTIREGVAIELTNENCNGGHRHMRARWLACGKPHALTIAKLKHSTQGWRVERGYRPPRIK